MIRIGVLGTANIAERRMIPAILKHSDAKYVGVAVATKNETGSISDENYLEINQVQEKKAIDFIEKFGGEIVSGYEEMLKRPDVDAVYIPLPPALHFKWIMLALQYGKHVLSEKPLTTSEKDSRAVIAKAQKRQLALVENYGFCYHKQLKRLRYMTDEGEIGGLRLIRAAFCFPHREKSDFRYKKDLGGGALLDCGGYTVKAASLFLGDKTRILSSNLVIPKDHEVDVYGSATVRNEDGLCAQLSFGMDNSYICELEVWGSSGSITATRAFTAPDEFKAPLIIKSGNNTKELFEVDDQFEEIVDEFLQCISYDFRREKEYLDMLQQSILVEAISHGNIVRQ